MLTVRQGGDLGRAVGAWCGPGLHPGAGRLQPNTRAPGLGLKRWVIVMNINKI